jgi:hypothetical protein
VEKSREHYRGGHEPRPASAATSPTQRRRRARHPAPKAGGAEDAPVPANAEPFTVVDAWSGPALRAKRASPPGRWCRELDGWTARVQAMLAERRQRSKARARR